MLIIKIIILYFIQIRHNDDFLSTGTRLAYLMEELFCTNIIRFVSLPEGSEACIFTFKIRRSVQISIRDIYA